MRLPRLFGALFKMKVKGTMDDQELSKLLSEYLPSDDTPDSNVAAAKEYAGKDVTDSVLDRNPSSVEDFAEENKK